MEYSLDEYYGRYRHSALHHEPWREVWSNDVVLNDFAFRASGLGEKDSLLHITLDDLPLYYFHVEMLL